MTRLAPGSLHYAATRRSMGKEWLKKVKSACPEVKWLSPDIESAHRVALISRSEGAVNAERWPALPYERFLEVLGEVSR